MPFTKTIVTVFTQETLKTIVIIMGQTIQYLSWDDVPRVEDSTIWFDAEDSWLDHTFRILTNLVVEVLVFGARSTSDNCFNIFLLSHIVAKLVRHIRVTLCDVNSSKID